MRKNEKALIQSYIYTQQQQYEYEFLEAQTKLRYGRIDIVDCTETMCALERLNTFMRISRDILTLLNLSLKEFTENEKE